MPASSRTFHLTTKQYLLMKWNKLKKCWKRDEKKKGQ